MELVGRDAVDGGNGATEDVIGALELFGLLNGVNVERLFDDENRRLVAVGVALKLRNFLVGVNQSEGDGAGFDAVMEAGERYGDVFADAGAVFEQEVSIALGGAGTNSGQMPEGFDGIR